jgi:hypothetical protein
MSLNITVVAKPETVMVLDITRGSVGESLPDFMTAVLVIKLSVTVAAISPNIE